MVMIILCDMSVEAQQCSRNLCAVSLGQRLKLLGVVGVVGSEPIPGNNGVLYTIVAQMNFKISGGQGRNVCVK